MLRILSILMCAGAVMLRAQTPAVETISIEQGLSQGFIADIHQDGEGFLWFATNSGLNRYDGYAFVVFKNDPYDPFSLPDNKVMAICETGDFLFLVTYSGPVLFHRRTRRFYSIPLKTPLLPYPIAKCRAENDHTVWLSLYQEGAWRLYRCSWPADAGPRLLRTPEVSGEIRFERMYGDREVTDFDLSPDRKTLWLAAQKNQVFQLNLPNGAPQPLRMDAPRATGFSTMALGAAAFCVLDGESRTMVMMASHPDRGAAYQVIPVAPMGRMRLLNFDARRQLLWVGVRKEVWGFDMSSPPDSVSRSRARHVLPLGEDARCAYTDRNGILWVGTDARGIRKFNPNTGLFKNYCTGHSVFCPPLADNQGNIWIGNFGNQQFNQLLDRASGRTRPYPIPELARSKFESRGVVAPDGSLWLTAVASDRQAPELVHYDPQTGQRAVFRYPSPFFDAIPVLFFDADRRAVWTAYSNKLLRFDLDSRQFSAIELDMLPKALPWVHACVKTDDGSLWLAYDVGLLRAAPRAGGFSFQLYRNDPDNRNSLAGNYVKSLLVDPADGMALWIGTAGYGLCRYDLRTRRFLHYNTRNGLSDDVVYGIAAEPADAANLWLSTNKGLIRFNTTRKTFRYFVQADGLQDNEFNTFAYGATPAGELMFGGVNGLTLFDPRALSQASSMPARALLTQLRINAKQVEPGQPDNLLQEGIEFSNAIELAHRQNNLYLQFMATDLAQPERNMFSYYMEGAEPEWAHTGFENSAQYLNLPPGAYRFKVKAANGEGVWNESPTVLNIRIHPPWYASGWAYALYAALLGMALRFLYRFQLRRKLEQAETHRLKELNTLKSRLFTNITHEFRTPLTVILGVADQLKPHFDANAPDALERDVEMLRRNGRQLLKLINQMLDLAKLESGRMQLNLVQDDASALIKYVVASNQSYAADKNVRVRFEADTDFLLMDIDQEKLQAIVSNLLSNAVKFSHPHGEVRVLLRQVQLAGEPFLALSVQDEGVGIPEAQLPYIFDRFYQADNSDTRAGEGTGIGLSLVQELVKLMNGSIQVESQMGLGTRFEVRLPIRREAHRRPTDFNQSEPPAADRRRSAPALIPAPNPDAPLLLLVEDNEDVRAYIAACLAGAYRIREAHNGRQGVDIALEQTPDLVISDVMMPEKDGLELCQILKSDARTSHIPIVLLTAKTSIENRIAGLRRGADAYLSKPFHRDELLLTIANQLRARQALQERLRAALTALPDAQPPAPPALANNNADALAALQEEDAFVRQVRRYVEENIDNAALSMEALSRAMTMSYQNLHRKLTALTGLPPVQFIRFIRLQKARELLQNTSRTITDIAAAVGFADPKYFSRVFTEEFGMPPSALRQQHKNQHN